MSEKLWFGMNTNDSPFKQSPRLDNSESLIRTLSIDELCATILALQVSGKSKVDGSAQKKAPPALADEADCWATGDSAH